MKYIHPLAKTLLKSINAFHVVSKFQNGITVKINTSPHFSDYAQYPDIENMQLKQKYIQYLTTYEKVPVSLKSDNILFTSGASEAIDLILRAFCEPFKDHICVTPPTFSLYEELAIRYNVGVERVNLLGMHFEFLDLTVLLKGNNRKIIYLCSPNNPVGTELKFNEIQHILTHNPSTIVVIDETYIDFASNQEWLPLLDQYTNLVFIRSFSKAWGLAGVRSGVVIANESIINALCLFQLPFSFSTPAQENLLKRFEHLNDIHNSINEIIHLRKRLFDFLFELDNVEMVYPSSTNFITAQFKNHEICFKSLARSKMLVTNLHNVIPKAIRFSIYDKKYIENLISTISSIINENTYV